MPGSSTDFCDNYGQTGLPVGLHGGLVRKESACNAGDPHLIPGSERSPGEENGNPLQYSSLRTEGPGSLQYTGSKKSTT